MILELDCGNSSIKWRVITISDDLVMDGIAHSDEELISTLKQYPRLSLKYGRLVSVRSDTETDALVQQLKSIFALECQKAKPVESFLGVRNGYTDYQRLGMDRWLALLGGFKLADNNACVVVDLGTAVTADFVDQSGQHVGGFICPGIPLMRRELQTHTRRIRYNPELEVTNGHPLPGRNTMHAVEGGCVYMLRGFIRTQYDLAVELFGTNFTMLLTGGDAELVKDVIPTARVVPDLVFIGLALACPVGS
jgi:type III pantothenate kinase